MQEPNDDHTLPTGYRLDEFEIIRVLGEGGFGIAYLAFDHSLRQQRVIKEFLPGLIARRERSGFRITALTGAENSDIFNEGLHSFISEARLLASLDHPNVVRVYRCLEANGTAYLVMHYYEGQTLTQRFKAMGRTQPDADWVIRLLAQLLHGLQVVHAQGILHRDIKPDNIYLLADDRPVLIDFGAARRLIGGRTKALTGVITEGYSPIEQYTGDGGLQEGPWTDLYALGATAYLLVTGRKPWNAVMRVAGDQLSPAMEAGQPNYPMTLLSSIDRALAVRHKDRYQSALEWLTALENPTVRVDKVTLLPAPKASAHKVAPRPAATRKADAETVVSRPVATPKASVDSSAPYRRLRALGIVVLLVLVAGVGGYFAWQNSRPVSLPVVVHPVKPPATSEVTPPVPPPPVTSEIAPPSSVPPEKPALTTRSVLSERMTVAVVEFNARGDLDEQAGGIMTDLMMSSMARSGRFILKDRVPLAAVARTRELESTGWLDAKTAAKLGRTYQVDTVVIGRIDKVGDWITVTARLIDAKTAALLRSGQIQDKDIDSIQIKIDKLAAMITAPERQ